MIGSRNLPATIVPGNPGFAQLKLYSLLPPGRLFTAATPLPLPTTRSSDGTRMCISAVKRFVNNPAIGNHRPG